MKGDDAKDGDAGELASEVPGESALVRRYPLPLQVSAGKGSWMSAVQWFSCLRADAVEHPVEAWAILAAAGPLNPSPEAIDGCVSGDINTFIDGIYPNAGHTIQSPSCSVPFPMSPGTDRAGALSRNGQLPINYFT